MKNRDLYLNQVIPFKDKSPIKVISGVRRCGKSTLLDLYEQYLLNQGVAPTSIIRMNFESLEFEEITNARRLYDTIKAQLGHGMNYIMLDEVQQVPEWEKAVNSLCLLDNTDLYITGSNAALLSSEIATLLSGRYVELRMLPLSFSEFLDFNGFDATCAMAGAIAGDREAWFNRYLEFGGFPGLTELPPSSAAAKLFAYDIYNTIIMKDVILRHNIRDSSLLDRMVRRLRSHRRGTACRAPISLSG
jgi:predicted AAA+ superfamily ATPase